MNSKIIFDDFEKALKNFEVALSRLREMLGFREGLRG